MSKTQQIELFIRRFDCVCRRLRNEGLQIETDSYYCGRGLKPGAAGRTGKYEIDTQLLRYHPIAITMSGRRRTPSGIIADGAKLLGVSWSTFEAFVIGFAGSTRNKDIWSETARRNKIVGYNTDESVLCSSWLFNLGAAFNMRFTGKYLTYFLDNQEIAKAFVNLPLII